MAEVNNNGIPIRDVETKNIMTKSTLPVGGYSVNPYVGCTHGCKYCYASFMKRFTGHTEPWGTFLDVKHWPAIKNPRKYAGQRVVIGSVTDGYQPQEEQFENTRKLLWQLKDSGAEILICTKSDLVVRDIDLLKEMGKVTVSWSINTLDEDFKNDMDNAVSIKRRLDAMKQVYDAGIRTVCFIAPVFPGITDFEAIFSRVKNQCDLVWLENLNLRGGFKKDILDYIREKYPHLFPLYDTIYNKGDRSYFRGLQEQAEHLASKWNNLIENEYFYLEKTLATHLFRLRKWMRKNDFNPEERFCVKEEFSSALILPEIPPFGEQFDFYEKIQGGSHFFAYAEHFVGRFKHFSQTHQVQALRNHLKWESHWKYADIIETLLFGYYLKFGELYLTEALFCISGYIAQHRYEATRALAYKIREYAKDSEIIMMIDQASSPTFFLAECVSSIKNNGRDIEEQGIAMRFYQRLQDLFSELYNDFTDLTIIDKYNNEYL